MKKALLFSFFVCFFAFSASAQISGDCQGCENVDQYQQDQSTQKQQAQITTTAKKKKISVFPNPAANFIGISDTKNVDRIAIFNVMGKEAKSFQVEKGLKYDVTDLKRGMYLVQIIDHQGKVITTQRLNKN